jgi:hypothetical protein
LDNSKRAGLKKSRRKERRLDRSVTVVRGRNSGLAIQWWWRKEGEPPSSFNNDGEEGEEEEEEEEEEKELDHSGGGQKAGRTAGMGSTQVQPLTWKEAPRA